MTQIESKVVAKMSEDDKEMDLIDLIKFLKNNVATLAICTVLGVVAGLGLFWYLPYKWEADVTLQVGKVPFLQTLDYITPPPEVVEKLKSPLYLKKMLVQMYGVEAVPGTATANLLYKDLKVSLLKGSGLIGVHVFGWSPKEAYRNATIFADTFVDDQRKAAESYLSSTKQRLADITANIARDKSILEGLDEIERKTPTRTEGGALLKLALTDAKSTEIEKLRTEQAKLQLLMSAAELQQARLIGRTLIPEAPSSPKLPLLLVGGGAVGFLIGLMIAFGIAVRRRVTDY